MCATRQPASVIVAMTWSTFELSTVYANQAVTRFRRSSTSSFGKSWVSDLSHSRSADDTPPLEGDEAPPASWGTSMPTPAPWIDPILILRELVSETFRE